jgi:hypothetical protein
MDNLQNIQFKDIKNKDSYIQTTTIFGTLAATSTNYGYVLTARGIALEILGVSEKHETAGTNGGAVTLDVVKVPDGSAISSGSSILVTQFNLKSTANTNVYKDGRALKTTQDIRYLQIGESIALKTTGTLTDVAGVHVCIYYRPVNNGSYR